MATDTFQLKRGTTAAVNAYLPAVGEPVYDITLKRFSIGDGVTMGGVAPSNAFTADKLTTARDIALTGTVTGTVSFDGSANVSMTTSVGASLQASLDLKAPLDSPILTGTPVAPTAAPGTNTTQLATTAYATAADAVLTTAINLKAPLASPSLTGIPLSTTPAVGTNTTQIATAAMVQAEIANKRAWTSYTPTITAASGTYTTVSATGSYMVAFGVCYIRVAITVTTKGTGVTPTFTLPFAALSGSAGMPLLARENAVNGKSGAAFITAGLTAAAVAAYDNTDLVTANGCVVVVQASYPIA